MGLYSGHKIINVSPTVLNADAYDANDTLFDTTEIANAAWQNDEAFLLRSVSYLDLADQTAAVINLFFLSANVTFGTKDSAPSISDADAAHLLGWVSLLAAEYVDVGGSKIATKLNVGLVLKPAAGTTSVYVAGTTAGTPTLATGSVLIRCGFERL